MTENFVLDNFTLLIDWNEFCLFPTEKSYLSEFWRHQFITQLNLQLVYGNYFDN